MFFYHLRLLLIKSLRYAWRRRTCRCCPKILFELLVPLICLLLLCLLRWIHTPSSTKQSIEIVAASIRNAEESQEFFSYPLADRCPPDWISIDIVNQTLLNSLQKKCPKSRWTPSNFVLNQSKVFYRCRFNNQQLCQNTSTDSTVNQLQHPSQRLCASSKFFNEEKQILTGYLSLQTLLHPARKSFQWKIFTWPCSSYATDPLFELAPGFVLVFILILIDGCVLFAFYFLLHGLLDEKRQGITELLRLISIQPILNSLSWFIRLYVVQLIPTICLLIIWKVSFDGGIYFPYVSIWLLVPTFLLWTCQVFSRAVLVGHFFVSNLKASLWSWFIYFLSFWLAMTTTFKFPFFLQLIFSAWLPFYSIKRLMILFFRLNTDQGRSLVLTREILLIWLSIFLGSIVMWFLAVYLDRVRPGKYGIPRPWSWLWTTDRRVRQSKRRQSIDMDIVETFPEENTTVRVKNLTKTYGQKNVERQIAVENISFKLEKSKIYGLIGHNGAGKTTTMEILCGLLSCDHGTIEIHDKDLHEHLNELQSVIGYCPQHDMLFSHLTVREQLEFYAAVRSQGKENVSKEHIDELLVMMDLQDQRNHFCHTLSGGMQRKLSILCAFAGNSNVIVLDEPSSSLDPVARRVLWSWLRENKTNRTLLISSHLLDEVEELCDSVIILDSGKISAQGTILELKRKFGPPGDRLHLQQIPSYVPERWIVDRTRSIIQIDDRHNLIDLLEKLENDQIKYSLDNITLDEIFIVLTSSTDTNIDENLMNQNQIRTLFDCRTSSKRSHLLFEQILAVVIRRGQVFLRRARLLPLVLILYLAYAFAPLYMPSFSSLGTENSIQYVLSIPSLFVDRFQLKKSEMQIAPSFSTRKDFENFLLQMNFWSQKRQNVVALRIVDNEQIECFVPSPHLPNILNGCLKLFNRLTPNRTILPFEFVSKNSFSSLVEYPALNMLKSSPMYFCFYTLPPSLHLSIILLSLILLICAALTIQDFSSGIHSYSLIHGLRSAVHWFVTYLTDLLLCVIWLAILVLIARFVHSSTFYGRFFALTPLFFIVNLPFIYLIGRFFNAPILGATTIIFLLLIAHVLNTFKVVVELFRGYRTLTIFIHVFRWVLLLVFPNVNVFTLIVSILRPSACPTNSDFVDTTEEFSHERYPHKILIHSLIFVGQWFVYFALLIFLDTFKRPILCRSFNDSKSREVEDKDVADERRRIETLNDEDRQKEALIVKNLSKRYGNSNVAAVNRLTFSVSHGECFGLLGFNGSGKTTTFRMLVGEIYPSAGHVFHKRDENVGYCPQDDIRFPALTVTQTIHFVCRLHGVDPSTLNDLILQQFQLEKYRNRLISHLSGGTCRRLHLALCLIGSPTLLLLDEPTAKVDPLLRSHIRLILQNRPEHTSIVFASHSMLECEQLCDRLTILVHGQAQCLGSPRHLKERYGKNYRIRLKHRTGREKEIPAVLEHVEKSDEFLYPKGSLAHLFRLLENLVEKNIIEPNYIVEITSLEHIFLAFQHS